MPSGTSSSASGTERRMKMAAATGFLIASLVWIVVLIFSHSYDSTEYGSGSLKDASAYGPIPLTMDSKGYFDRILAATSGAIRSIQEEWEIEKYPLFLKSCAMHRTSWEVMKLKFMAKLLSSIHHGKNETFIASFLGSSVTAGHDSLFVESYPVVAANYMRGAFESSGVSMITRNVALGNNPCVPYDICVRTFAGLDADLVHWEQTYFCEGDPVLEQFVRQAMFSPSKPIVVFDDSSTANWGEDECRAPASKLTAQEKSLLTASPIDLVSDKNMDEFHKHWSQLLPLVPKYPSAGIQTFSHYGHSEYACQGPYIKSWRTGAASWHPSVVAHRLRAAQFAYFWLLVWKDAIQAVKVMLTYKSSGEALTEIKERRLGEEIYKKSMPARFEPPHFPGSPFADNMQCFTDYEPRAERGSSLRDRVVAGLARSSPSATTSEGEEEKGWKEEIFENIADKNMIRLAAERGYKDFKHMIFGDESSGPLSIQFHTEKTGPVFLCETPGIWGKLPEGFTHLHSDSVEERADVYMTTNVPPIDPKTGHFNFSIADAKKVVLSHTKSLDLCVSIRPPSGSVNFPAGNNVLTIVPRSSKKIIVAWLLTG